MCMVPNRQLRSQRKYESIELLRAAFGARFDAAPGTCLFDRLEWFDMLARHCFADTRLVIGHAVDGAGVGSVLLPLVESGNHLEALANWYSFSFAPLFFNVVPEQREELLTDIARQVRASHGHIRLYPLLDGDGSASRVARAFHNAGWMVSMRVVGHNHLLRLRGRNFAAYWAERPGILRNRVKRKGRGHAFTFHIHDCCDAALWQDYCAVYAASWKPDEPSPALLRALVEDASARGALRLGFAMKDGIPVATQLWTIEGDTALIHKLAHDKSQDADSPGTLLSHHMFAHAIDRDHVTTIDYGTGDNDYKREWMEEERPMWRIDCYDPRRVAQWPPAAKAMISGLVARIKGR